MITTGMLMLFSQVDNEHLDMILTVREGKERRWYYYPLFLYTGCPKSPVPALNLKVFRMMHKDLRGEGGYELTL